VVLVVVLVLGVLDVVVPGVVPGSVVVDDAGGRGAVASVVGDEVATVEEAPGLLAGAAGAGSPMTRAWTAPADPSGVARAATTLSGPGQRGGSGRR
jgi:hypothetical protein